MLLNSYFLFVFYLPEIVHCLNALNQVEMVFHHLARNVVVVVVASFSYAYGVAYVLNVVALDVSQAVAYLEGVAKNYIILTLFLKSKLCCLLDIYGDKVDVALEETAVVKVSVVAGVVVTIVVVVLYFLKEHVLILLQYIFFSVVKLLKVVVVEKYHHQVYYFSCHYY